MAVIRSLSPAQMQWLRDNRTPFDLDGKNDPWPEPTPSANLAPGMAGVLQAMDAIAAVPGLATHVAMNGTAPRKPGKRKGSP